MSFERAAHDGHVLGTLRHGILTGSLWAIGISWSTSIRAITLTLLPDDTADQVIGEIISTAIVTVVGVGTALLVGRCRAPSRSLTPPSTQTHPTRASSASGRPRASRRP